MADNYLEKRMEDYAKGRGTAARTSVRRAGWITVRYPAVTVYVRGADTAAGEAVVGAFVQAGCKVVFTASDRRAGTEVAQRSGGRFYPADTADMLADMGRRGETVDVEVVCDGSAAESEAVAPKLIILAASGEELPAGIDAVIIAGDDTEQAARVALMVAHRSAAMPRQVIRV